MKTAHKRLLAMALAALLVCALFYGCNNKEPELPPEDETETEFTTEDPWAFEEETTEEEESEEETEPPTTTRRATTTTRRTTTTTKTSTTTTTNSAQFTTIGDYTGSTTTTTTTKSSTSTAYVKVTDVSFNGASSYTLTAGKTQNLSWAISPANANNKGVVFFTSNSAVATVTAGGVVTAKGAGTCTITIKTTDPQADANYEDTVNITVTAVMVTRINIIGNATVGVGGTLPLTADVQPSNASNKSVTWSITGGTGTATINSSNGRVTGVSAGTIVIRATANDGSGVTGSATITVT